MNSQPTMEAMVRSEFLGACPRRVVVVVAVCSVLMGFSLS
jgi:hypothetical protein